MALTSKKRLFADALLAGKNNKQAALAAGYSAASASAAGSRLAKDKDVLAYMTRVSEALEEKTTPPVNSSDGAEKPAPAFDLKKALSHSDPRAFLLAAMNDGLLEPKLRIDAAKALMPFEFAKKGESSGKKEDAAAKAKAAAQGKFGRREPPKLVAAGGKPV